MDLLNVVLFEDVRIVRRAVYDFQLLLYDVTYISILDPGHYQAEVAFKDAVVDSKQREDVLVV